MSLVGEQGRARQVELLHETTQEAWDHLMAVNVRSIFFSVKHAIPHLRRRDFLAMITVL